MHEDLIARLDKSYQALNNTFHAKEFVEPIKEAAEVLHLADTGKTSNWISVEEDGLPLVPGEYLVYVRCGIPCTDTDILEMVDLDYVTTAYFNPDTCLWNENQEYYNGNLACIDKTKCYYISHWADKPTPPKEEA